ncbi:hypothetical protein D3C86_1258770 [compost metagenome]
MEPLAEPALEGFERVVKAALLPRDAILQAAAGVLLAHDPGAGLVDPGQERGLHVAPGGPRVLETLLGLVHDDAQLADARGGRLLDLAHFLAYPVALAREALFGVAPQLSEVAHLLGAQEFHVVARDGRR